MCPINILSERLKYLPKPASLRLELGNCRAAADSEAKDDTPTDSEPGSCELIGGFGVRGTVQCGRNKFHCCSKRACEWEAWLQRHREADKSDKATCAFTKKDKVKEVKRTVSAWAPHASPAGVKAKDLGIDFEAAQKENWKALLAHEKKAKQWFWERSANNTLPIEFACPWSPDKCYRACKQSALEFAVPPTAATIISPDRGLIMPEMAPLAQPHTSKPI